MARAVESSTDAPRRFYRQSPGERWWFAVILLPALLTAAFVATSGPAIEHDLGLSTSQALQSNGVIGVQVEMSGRNATLKVPTGQSQEQALAVASAIDGIGDVKVDNVARSAAEERACQRLEETMGNADEVLSFAGSSTGLSGSAVGQVSALSKLLLKCPAVTVKVSGHTDGSVVNASVVSLRRAEAVRDALVRDGVKATRIKTQGYGDSLPASSEDTPTGRALNNRVTITLEEE
ncbi:MAG TPA: OmpA family protein [Nocardioidaceae bacterium]|nr:OmpA family protein [Nocardioidaceae bacterium]